MRTLLEDLRSAGRQLLHSPGFSGTTVATLALSVSVCTVVMAVLYAANFQPLPYRNADRLVHLFEFMHADCAPACLDQPLYNVYEQWKEQAHSFDAVESAEFHRYWLAIGDEQTQAPGARVSPGYFTTLGVTPLLGRLLDQSDFSASAEPAVLISYRLWREQFAGASDVLSKKLGLGGVSYAIVGVMPANFDLPNWAQFWVPAQPLATAGGPAPRVDVIARLRRAASIGQAQAELALISQRRESQDPKSNAERVGTAVGMRAIDRGRASSFWMLLGAAGATLAVACANVASLFLARGLRRRREMAVRAAMGASQWRLARLLTTEAVLLLVAGGLLGILLAFMGRDVAAALIERYFHYRLPIALSVWVFAAEFAVLLVLGVIVGMAPAASLRTMDLQRALREAAATATRGKHEVRLRYGVVVLEVAGALALLMGATLLTRSYLYINSYDLGYDPTHLLEGSVGRLGPGTADPRQVLSLAEQLLERLNRSAGVNAASVWDETYPRKSFRPFSEQMTLEGTQPQLSVAAVPSYSYDVSGDFFRTIGIAVVRGRAFGPQDGATAIPVAIINQEAARLWWPHQDPLGQRFKLGPADSPEPWLLVVGVVRNTHTFGRESVFGALENAGYFPLMFRPIEQTAPKTLQVAIRSAASPARLLHAIRTEIGTLNSAFTLTDLEGVRGSMSEFGPLAISKLTARLLSAFALFAVFLALMGVHAIIADAVEQRRHEIGIRMALGARPWRVLTRTMGDGVRLAALGIVLGVGASMFSSGLLRGLLYNISPDDPATYVAVAAAMIVTVAVASFGPARRATRIDPVTVLRYE